MIGRIIRAILLSLLPILSACADTTNSASDVSAKIAAMVQNIKAEPSTGPRRRAMDDFVDFIWHQDQSAIDAVDADTIDQIASLLNDPNDFVKGYAARALKRFGPHAARAVFALQKALKAAEPPPNTAQTGIQLDQELHAALEAITGKPEERNGGK